MSMYGDELKSEAQAYVDEVWDDVLRDIDRLVRVESVEDLPHAAPGAPFGPKVAQALHEALGIAERLGLETHDLDGYVGYARLAGASDKVVATICHSDIVPLGEGWSVDPLSVTMHEGFLLGRGVQDDKGPLVVSLYAAGFFARKARELGRPLPYTLHAIVGANEETSMADVPHYLEACGEPAFLFTPDADFPLICGEKGVFHGALTSGPTESGESALVSISGGTVPNAIPGTATATVLVDASELPGAPGIEVRDAGAGIARIDARGKGGHASMPEGTVNAIGVLVGYLLSTVRLSDAERSFLRLVRQLCSTYDGSAAGIACADEVFGPLTCIAGTIRSEGGRLVQTVDSRYPRAITGDAIADAFRALASSYGATFRVLDDAVPYYSDPTSEPVQALLATYEEYTGDMAQPLVIGGGTYARHFAHACAFGPNDPNEHRPAWAGIEHGPDEAISERTLRQALTIYIVAIARLMDLTL